MKGKRWLIAGAAVVVLAGILLSVFYGRRIHGRGSYAIIMKSRHNWYNELASRGYRQVIEGAGKNCIILYPDNATAQEQIGLIRNLIHEQVDGIAVAANDEYALSPVLKEAREKGISVVTLDADTEADSRSIYIKPVDGETLGRELVQSLLQVSGGSGQWAILSAGSRSANQNEWIYWMKRELEEARYQDLRLVDIAFGDGVYETAYKEAGRLLDTYPGMKVICSLSTEGIKAAADAVKDRGLEKDVKVMGLGLPGQMAGNIGDGDTDVCPVIFIWNPVMMGEVAAYISLGLGEDGMPGLPESGRLDLAAGEIKLQNGESYRLDTGRSGGIEVISGEPIRVDKGNLEYWKTQF